MTATKNPVLNQDKNYAVNKLCVPEEIGPWIAAAEIARHRLTQIKALLNIYLDIQSSCRYANGYCYTSIDEFSKRYDVRHETVSACIIFLTIAGLITTFEHQKLVTPLKDQDAEKVKSTLFSYRMNYLNFNEKFEPERLKAILLYIKQNKLTGVKGVNEHVSQFLICRDRTAEPSAIEPRHIEINEINKSIRTRNIDIAIDIGIANDIDSKIQNAAVEKGVGFSSEAVSGKQSEPSAEIAVMVDRDAKGESSVDERATHNRLEENDNVTQFTPRNTTELKTESLDKLRRSFSSLNLKSKYPHSFEHKELVLSLLSKFSDQYLLSYEEAGLKLNPKFSKSFKGNLIQVGEWLLELGCDQKDAERFAVFLFETKNYFYKEFLSNYHLRNLVKNEDIFNEMFNKSKTHKVVKKSKPLISPVVEEKKEVKKELDILDNVDELKKREEIAKTIGKNVFHDYYKVNSKDDLEIKRARELTELPKNFAKKKF